jgi:Patatin phospholipase
MFGETPAQSQLVHKFARVIGETHCRDRVQLIYRLDEPEGSLQDFKFSRPTMELRWQGLCGCADDLAGFPMARPMPIDVGFVSGRFAMIYVVDAKFFESAAGDADRCLESQPGVVRDGARVKSPEPVMRRLPRRKVK